MKKEAIYSLRMSKTVRDALKRAAKKESRTVASLLDKIIKDYLERNGLLTQSNSIAERRWFTRKDIFKPANIYFEEKSERKEYGVVVLNISLGGVLIAYPKATGIRISAEDLPNFELCLELTGVDRPLCLDCEANRKIDSGFGVQVGANFVTANQDDLRTLRTYLN